MKECKKQKHIKIDIFKKNIKIKIGDWTCKYISDHLI